jgi:hypothetical protein
VATVRIAAVTALKMIGRGKNKIRPFVVEILGKKILRGFLVRFLRNGFGWSLHL